jgi:hypothetical protein
METQTFETRPAQRSTRFPAISWGAIFAGLASGFAVQLLLILFGLAAGLSAVDPQSAGAGRIPLMAGIWTGISLILSAFTGGFVAAMMSGFSRLADGLLHGMVAWGISTVLFAYALTTSVGSLIGGAFGIAGQSARAVAGGVAGSPAARNQLLNLLKGSAGGEGEISQKSLTALQKRLAAGDRDGAVDVMVSRMGFSQKRAEQVVDRGEALFGSGQNMPQQARGAAASAVSGLSKASWGLFIALLLSMILGITGGALGSRTAVKRRHPLAHSH